jgi:hypothetical protein
MGKLGVTGGVAVPDIAAIKSEHEIVFAVAEVRWAKGIYRA